jgi:inhibitor of KinA
MYDQPRYLASGDRALIVEFGDEIDPVTNSRVRALQASLQNCHLPGLLESTVSYRSLLIIYDPLIVGFEELTTRVQAAERDAVSLPILPSRKLVIPTLYGGDAGPDIAYVASHNKLRIEDVVSLHCSVEYLVYMIGFTPGFPYLGGMPAEIAAPRLDVPRRSVPPGAVGIAGNQTGIYPTSSPGGWRLIGRTPLRLYEPSKPDPVLLRAGDTIRFRPISDSEFQAIVNEAGEYPPGSPGENESEAGEFR